MSFRRFLDASYALFVESFLTVGPNKVDLLSAVEKVEGIWKRPEEQPEPKLEDIRAKNTAAIEELKKMMAGVKGAPLV